MCGWHIGSSGKAATRKQKFHSMHASMNMLYVHIWVWEQCTTSEHVNIKLSLLGNDMRHWRTIIGQHFWRRIIFYPAPNTTNGLVQGETKCLLYMYITNGIIGNLPENHLDWSDSCTKFTKKVKGHKSKWTFILFEMYFNCADLWKTILSYLAFLIWSAWFGVNSNMHWLSCSFSLLWATTYTH